MWTSVVSIVPTTLTKLTTVAQNSKSGSVRASFDRDPSRHITSSCPLISVRPSHQSRVHCGCAHPVIRGHIAEPGGRTCRAAGRGVTERGSRHGDTAAYLAAVADPRGGGLQGLAAPPQWKLAPLAEGAGASIFLYIRRVSQFGIYFCTKSVISTPSRRRRPSSDTKRCPVCPRWRHSKQIRRPSRQQRRSSGTKRRFFAYDSAL